MSESWRKVQERVNFWQKVIAKSHRASSVRLRFRPKSEQPLLLRKLSLGKMRVTIRNLETDAIVALLSVKRNFGPIRNRPARSFRVLCRENLELTGVGTDGAHGCVFRVVGEKVNYYLNASFLLESQTNILAHLNRKKLEVNCWFCILSK